MSKVPKFGSNQAAALDQDKPISIKIACQALNKNGERCNNPETEMREYHGESELYYDVKTTKMPQWVRVYLCATHRDQREPARKPTKTKTKSETEDGRFTDWEKHEQVVS